MNKLLDETIVHEMPSFETEAQTITQPPPDWANILTKATITSEELRQMEVPARERVLGNWFLESDLGFFFAPRGVGKTLLTMAIANAIASGGKAGPWDAPKARRVLYVDGEMALDLTKKRNQALSQVPSTNLMFLHHEVVFQRTGKVLNLTSLPVQEALLKYIVNHQIEVLILDNLSCLFSGVKENDADAWELILPWLLQLRRQGIAVVIVAHAGRNGLMRGTSRREDAAAWVLSLTEAAATNATNSGAKFTSNFTKCRNVPINDVPPLEWHFQRIDDELIDVKHTVAEPLLVFRGWIEDGLDTCGDIASEMGISKGAVSKLAKRAKAAGWLKMKGRSYKLVDDQPEGN